MKTKTKSFIITTETKVIKNYRIEAISEKEAKNLFITKDFPVLFEDMEGEEIVEIEEEK